MSVVRRRAALPLGEGHRRRQRASRSSPPSCQRSAPVLAESSASHDLRERGAALRRAGRGPRARPRPDRGEHRVHVGALEGAAAGQHLVQHHAEGPDVGAGVDVALAERLLVAHVLRRPEHLPRRRQGREEHRVGRGGARLADAEVDDLADGARAPSPSAWRITLAGLRSRWTMPWAWSAARPSARLERDARGLGRQPRRGGARAARPGSRLRVDRAPGRASRRPSRRDRARRPGARAGSARAAAPPDMGAGRAPRRASPRARATPPSPRPARRPGVWGQSPAPRRASPHRRPAARASHTVLLAPSAMGPTISQRSARTRPGSTRRWYHSLGRGVAGARRPPRG